MYKRIGVLGGREPFAAALCERLGREPGIVAEHATVGAQAERPIGRYDLIVDRLSDRVPHVRAYLKAAAVGGAIVLNDPLRAAEIDRFYALCLGARLGLNVPRAVLLPQRGYGAAVAPERDLSNLEYPLGWDAIAHFVGFPALVRSVHGRLAQRVNSLGELLAVYDASGETVLMVQRSVSATHARAIVAGERALCRGELPAPACREGQAAALAMARALGLSLCGIDLGWDGARVWLLDASDAVPQIDAGALGEENFQQLVSWTAEKCVAAARDHQGASRIVSL